MTRTNERAPEAGTSGAAGESSATAIGLSLPTVSRQSDRLPHVTRASVIAAAEHLAARGLDSEVTDAVLWRLLLSLPAEVAA